MLSLVWALGFQGLGFKLYRALGFLGFWDVLGLLLELRVLLVQGFGVWGFRALGCFGLQGLPGPYKSYLFKVFFL